MLGDLADQGLAVAVRHPVAGLDAVVALDGRLELRLQLGLRAVGVRGDHVLLLEQGFTDRSVCYTLTRHTGAAQAAHARDRSEQHVSALLESYAAGRWFRADDDGRPVLDAVTGDEVARVSSTGLDLGSMVAHGREVGGPALRALTFHERASLLKQVAKVLLEHKDEFYDLSFRTGATRRDSAVDIDGGIGTVFSIASKGTREMPNDTVVLDGGLEQLGRGRHLRRPARLHQPPRRRRADQRLQLPGLGHAREARPRLPRRGAHHREARRPDGLPHRGGGPPHHRDRSPPRGHAAAALRQPAGPARRADGAGPGRVHRIGPHRRAAAHPHQRRPRRRPARASRPTRSTARSWAPT